MLPLCRSVSPSQLQADNETLKRQLAEARATIADRDSKIEKLARDVAMLQDAIKHLLARRGGGHRVPAGQGLLFPEAASLVEAPKAEEAAADDGDETGDSDEDDSARRSLDNSGRKRTPRKIDTTGLPREDRLHDVPEDQRIDPVTGQIGRASCRERVLTDV